jgi:hypothetical protein
MQKITFLLLIGLIAWSSCTQQGDIRAYYFPMKDLTEGLVYEYRPVEDDSLPVVYWYYRSFVYPDSVFLTGTKYGENLLPEQFTREELVGNGMLTVATYIYELDSLGNQYQAPVDILAGSSYPFEVSEDGGVFLHSLQWRSKVDPAVSFEVVKNRRFGGDTTLVWDGKKQEAIYLNVREAIDQNAEGTLSLESEGQEVYVKNVGLVYFDKEFESGFRVAYRLADRYDMDVLEEKFTELYGRE